MIRQVQSGLNSFGFPTLYAYCNHRQLGVYGSRIGKTFAEFLIGSSKENVKSEWVKIEFEPFTNDEIEIVVNTDKDEISIILVPLSFLEVAENA